MEVTFTRTGEKRYAVRVERERAPALHMHPAPGYDPLLPHDLVHFAAERAYGIAHGVFGQLAAGGDVRTFHRVEGAVDRRLRRRGERLVRAYAGDLARSEELTDRALRTWYRGRRPAGDEQLERACSDFDDLSRRWRTLGIGGSLTLQWPETPARIPVHSQRRRDFGPRRRSARGRAQV